MICIKGGDVVPDMLGMLLLYVIGIFLLIFLFCLPPTICIAFLIWLWKRKK